MGTKNALDISVTRQSVPSSITRAGSADGLWPVPIISVLQSDFTLTAGTGVQTAFSSGQDVITLEGSTTYLFEGQFDLTTGTTAHTLAIAWLAGSGLTINLISYQTRGWSSVANTTATATNGTWITQLASTVITASSGTAGKHVFFKGIINVNAGGTLTPQIKFSANPTGTNLMKAGSYFMFTPLGTNTFTTIGPVS